MSFEDKKFGGIFLKEKTCCRI